MADEAKPMSSLAIQADDRHKAELPQDWLAPRKQGAGVVAWFQRGLLTLLILTHCIYPYWLGRESDLLRDSMILAQTTLLLVLFTMGGLGTRASLVVLVVAAIPALDWYLDYFFYTPYLLWYASTWLLPYVACSTLVLVSMRLAGYRGTWQERSYEPKPLQVSILTLLMVMTLVAVVLTGSSLLRQFAVVGWSNDQRHWISSVTDSVIFSALTAFLVICVGRPGSPVLRSLVLGSAMLILGACNVYAFRLEEDFWQLPVFTMLAWSVATVGSLVILRVCGWHVVLPRRDLAGS